jgi:hypothetical protein
MVVECTFSKTQVISHFIEIDLDALIPSDLHAYGAAWGDYDRDGLLDVYICSYNIFFESIYSNYLLHNLGQGEFEEVASPMGVNSADDNAFQPCWIDFNGDGWLDLHIINDHLIGNEYFENLQGQSFIDRSSESGLGVEMDAMCNSISDFDNDGDFDIYITNHWDGNHLMRNDNGIFANKAGIANVEVTDFCWGGLWIDYDLDGFDDLQICSSMGVESVGFNYVFHNEGDGTFSTSDAGSLRSSFSCAKADFNNDFRWDYAVYNALPTDISIFQNTNTSNHSIKISLRGTVSNYEGIGSFIEYFTDGQRKIVQTQSGENYIAQDSQYEILATGSSTVIDSLFIHWPLGWTDKHYNLSSDQFYSFVEGEMFVSSQSIDIVICEGDSIVLDAGNAESHVWNSGEESQFLSVDEEGLYSVSRMNLFGFEDTIHFTIYFFASPEIPTQITQPTCHGFSDGAISILLPVNDYSNFVWQHEAAGTTLENLSEGQYELVVEWNNSCTTNYMFEIQNPMSISITYTTDTLCAGETISTDVIAQGGTGNLTIDWFGIDPNVLSFGNYPIQISDENMCVLDTTVLLISYPEINYSYDYVTPCFGETTTLNYEVSGGTGTIQIEFYGTDPNSISPDNYQFTLMDEAQCSLPMNVTITSLPQINFEYSYDPFCDGDVAELIYSASGGSGNYTFDFQDINPLAVSNGLHQVIITDENNCSAYQEFQITSLPPFYADIDVINPTEFESGSIEIIPQGGMPPYSYLNNNEASDSIIYFNEPNTYFITISDDFGCTFEISVSVLEVESVSDHFSIEIFPNPFIDELNVLLNSPGTCSIYDATGKFILKSSNSQQKHRLNLESLPSGLYFIEAHGVYKMITK